MIDPTLIIIIILHWLFMLQGVAGVLDLSLPISEMKETAAGAAAGAAGAGAAGAAGAGAVGREDVWADTRTEGGGDEGMYTHDWVGWRYTLYTSRR
jgi:hypothetical protein